MSAIRKRKSDSNPLAGSPKKKSKKEIRRKTIVTHNGKFRCDQVLSCYMLTQHTKKGEFQNAVILRTGDPNEFKKHDMALDCGAIYNEKKKRYDHNQKKFNETFSARFKTKLSTVGLVYRAFGKQVLSDIILKHSREVETIDVSNVIESNSIVPRGATEQDIETLFPKVYATYIQHIDAADNGIRQYGKGKEKEKLYEIGSDICSRVERMNPWYNQRNDENEQMSRFKKAMAYVGQEFVDHVVYLYREWLPERRVVEVALDGRFSHHNSGRIMCLNRWLVDTAWTPHFFDIIAENPKAVNPIPWYAMVQSEDERDRTMWRIYAMPTKRGAWPGKWECIKKFPSAWHGLVNDKNSQTQQLNAVCPVRNGYRCVPNGTFCQAWTQPAALQMAVLAIQSSEPVNGQAVPVPALGQS